MKHDGGNVMIWGCFGNNKPKNILTITGKLNKGDYLKTIQDSAIPRGLSFIGPELFFQQDNDSKHSYKLCQKFLKRNSNAFFKVWNSIAVT